MLISYLCNETTHLERREAFSLHDIFARNGTPGTISLFPSLFISGITAQTKPPFNASVTCVGRLLSLNNHSRTNEIAVTILNSIQNTSCAPGPDGPHKTSVTDCQVLAVGERASCSM